MVYKPLNKLVAVSYTSSNIKLNSLEINGYPTNLPLLYKLANDLKRKNSTTAKVDVFVYNENFYRKVRTFKY